MIVVVTGASGFVGKNLCEFLVGRKHQVRAVLRRPAADAVPGREDHIVVDFADREALVSAFTGADAVVHAAARVHQMGPQARGAAEVYERVNVAGSRSVFEAAARAGARKCIFVSSVHAGTTTEDQSDSPDAGRHPSEAYGRSKLEAERVLLAMSAPAGFEGTVLRLPMVYGPGMKGNMLPLFAAVHRGVPLPFGGVRNQRSLVYVGNVAAAIEALLHCKSAGGRVFFVADGRPVSTPELLRLVGASIGRPARVFRVPSLALVSAGLAGDILQRFRAVTLSTAAMQRLTESLVVDSGGMASACGFSPPFSIEQGLAETGRWYLRARANPARGHA